MRKLQILNSEYTIDTKVEVHASEAVMTDKGEWIRYSTPYEDGAEYIAICKPAFSMDRAHRDP